MCVKAGHRQLGFRTGGWTFQSLGSVSAGGAIWPEPPQGFYNPVLFGNQVFVNCFFTAKGVGSNSYTSRSLYEAYNYYSPRKAA